MTITVSDIVGDVRRHLSVIGKRFYSKDGKNMFSNITLSSAEDTNLLQQYVYSAAQNVEATCRQFVNSFVLSGGTVVISLTNTRAGQDFDSRVQEIIKSYFTLYSVGEYLAMAHPDIAKKYYGDADQKMEALVSYVFYKNTPTTEGDPLAASASVS